MRHILILAALLCVSCGTQLPSIKPFKLDIQQGNVVTSKMLLQLRPGMTKSQVRFIMGTPLVQDSFHGNRWDYVYQMRENGVIKEQRRVILDFEKELLKSVRGDVVPAGSDLAKEPETVAPTVTRVVPPVKVEKDKSLLDKLKFWADDEPKAESAASAKQELKHNAERVSPPPVIAAPAIEADTKQVPEEAPSMLAVPIAVPDAAKAISLPATEAAPALPATESSASQSVAAPAAVVSEPAASQPAASAPVVSEPVASEPVVSAPTAAPAPPAAVIEPIAIPQESAAPAIEDSEMALPKLEQPTNLYHYQSPAGMQFDRKLQIEDEQVPPVIEPSGSRTGNKVAPQPKPLPPETEPSFFDRMLEQIGF